MKSCLPVRAGCVARPLGCWSRGQGIESLVHPCRASGRNVVRGRVPSGYRRCRNVPIATACPAMRCVTEQRFCTSGEHSPRWPDRHGKEGVAGSSPAESFRNRAAARSSCSRRGSGDHFLAERKWSLAARANERRRTALRVCRRLAVTRSDRSSSPVSARVPSGNHSVANGVRTLGWDGRGRGCASSRRRWRPCRPVERMSRAPSVRS